MPTTAPTPLAARVARTCLAADRLAPGARVLVAASAGADSTALAALLVEGAGHGLPLHLVLGHVDHGWRGRDEADADRALLEGLARRLELSLLCSPPAPADIPHTEDGARRWRYRWLGATAREHGLTHVATAHHAGDQAETFLMRLLRGSGLVGLAGIPPVRPLGPQGPTIVRPLLEIEPQALRQFLVERGLTWREDHTNLDLARDRTRMRARLKERQARTGSHDPVPTLAALAQRLRRRLEEREAALERRARGRFQHHRMAGAVEMPRALLAPLRGEFLALMLRHAGRLLHAESEGPWFTRRHISRFEHLLAAGGDLDLPRGLRLHVAGARAWLTRREMPARPLPRIRRRDMPRGAFDLETHQRENRMGLAAFDADRLGASPRLRLLRKGDRFLPHGRGGESEVDIVAWLSRRGMPAFARRGQVVLEGATGIAWVLGQRVDKRCLIGPQTERVAVAEVIWPD